MAKPLCCWHCGESVDDVPRPISRHANCDHCFEVLRCCRMCRHYNPQRRPYCDHDLSDPPEVKENANFCEYYAPVNRYDASQTSDVSQAKSKLNSLFEDPDSAQEEAGDHTTLLGDNVADEARTVASSKDDAKSKFDDLFGDD